MQRIALIIILTVASSFPVLAEDQSSGKPRQPYAPSLADIMGAMQLRHFKLWYAGNVKNWALAEYELGQINASFEDAMKLYPSLPAADMRVMGQPSEEVRSAIAAKDRTKFGKAFEKLTAACDACHEQLGFGFIDIRVPMTSPMMTSPFSDQSFAPK